MVFWEHRFFGAERGWDQNAWQAYPGDEIYCADPIHVPRLTGFASSYQRNSSDIEDVVPRPDEINPRSSRESSRSLVELPLELFDRICSFMSLRTAQDLRNTCRTTHRRLDDCAPFWRRRIFHMHGDWFWELCDTKIFPYHTTRWRLILWQVETARSDILESAGGSVESPLDPFVSWKLCEAQIYRPMQFDREGRPRLPLGLKNRLRIWCCLQSIGKDGSQNTLPGQTKGTDKTMVETDRAAEYANNALLAVSLVPSILGRLQQGERV